MPTTMKDLAYMAGVSRATVYRALSGRGRVDPETQIRICALAESMGYKPNLAAKSLANRRKNYKVGCIINSIGNNFFEDVIAGAKQAAEEYTTFGVSVIIKASKGFNVQAQLNLINDMLQNNVNAIAITPINDEVIIAKLNEVIKAGVSIVAVTADITGVDYLAYVGCNHEKSGRIAADLISLLTNEKAIIGVIAGSLKMLGHKQRIDGLKTVIEQKYPNINICSIVENQDDNIISYNKVTQLLKDRPDIDVLFFVAAGTSGGIRAVIENGFANKVKIITFDLTETNRKYLSQGIISAVLCQEPFKQGYTAIKLISDYLISNQKPTSFRIYTQTEINLRESLDS
jgi:LacI family transcriptional regulator